MSDHYADWASDILADIDAGKMRYTRVHDDFPSEGAVDCTKAIRAIVEYARKLEMEKVTK